MSKMEAGMPSFSPAYSEHVGQVRSQCFLAKAVLYTFYRIASFLSPPDLPVKLQISGRIFLYRANPSSPFT
jgi:hypothetical protein